MLLTVTSPFNELPKVLVLTLLGWAEAGTLADIWMAIPPKAGRNPYLGSISSRYSSIRFLDPRMMPCSPYRVAKLLAQMAHGEI